MSAPIYSVSEWKSSRFDMIIDVRAPEEFQIDHIPSAVNMPVLTDTQRAEVGTIYKQVSPFEARKLGASYISHNISVHLKNGLLEKSKDFMPLVYCWRGGQRSGAFNSILSEIGWQTYRLKGGYKTYRQDVINQLDACSGSLKLVVLAGYTGAAKTRVLNVLRQRGEQVIDLEQLAGHRGSLLGKINHKKQPSQKKFESDILSTLDKMSTSKHIYVEAESSTIGNLILPAAILQKLKSAPIIWLEVPLDSRSDFLINEYAWLTEKSDTFNQLLNLIKRKGDLRLAELVAENISRNEWKLVAENLLSGYYDPAYRKSLKRSQALKLAEITQDNCSSCAINATAGTIIRIVGDELCEIL